VTLYSQDVRAQQPWILHGGENPRSLSPGILYRDSASYYSIMRTVYSEVTNSPFRGRRKMFTNISIGTACLDIINSLYSVTKRESQQSMLQQSVFKE
jgi:hypothetical protein